MHAFMRKQIDSMLGYAGTDKEMHNVAHGEAEEHAFTFYVQG